MFKSKICLILLTTLVTGVLSNYINQQAEDRYIQNPRTIWNFNPFNVNYWNSIPSYVWQFWFPLFGPAFHPHKVTEKPPFKKPGAIGESTPLTQNIFGISNDISDDLEYLPPPNEIEW